MLLYPTNQPEPGFLCLAIAATLFGFVCLVVFITIKRRTNSKKLANYVLDLAIVLDVFCVLFQAAGILPLHFLPLTYVADVVVIAVIVIVVVQYRHWKVMVTCTVFHLSENFRSQKLKAMEVPHPLEVFYCEYLKKTNKIVPCHWGKNWNSDVCFITFNEEFQMFCTTYLCWQSHRTHDHDNDPQLFNC